MLENSIKEWNNDVEKGRVVEGRGQSKEVGVLDGSEFDRRKDVHVRVLKMRGEEGVSYS